MCKPVPETDVSVDPSEYSTPLQLHVTWRSGRLVLTVVGEVDMTTAPRLAQALTECLDQHPEELQLDLAGVSFLSAAGLTVLIQARARAQDRGIRFGTLVVSRAVYRPLVLTGLDTVFDVRPVPFPDTAAPTGRTYPRLVG